MYEPVDIIKNVLNAHTLDEERSQPTRAAASFHASEILHCQRRLVYDRLGFPKEPTKSRAEWIRDRDVGTAMHTFYENKLEKAGILIKKEGTLPANPYEIGARFDGIIQLGDEKIIVELKTVKERYWKEVPKGDKFRDHYAQSQMYLHFLGFPHALIVYINRNSNEIKEFLIGYDPVMVQEVLNRTTRLKLYKDSSIIPRWQPSKLECGFCAFTSICALHGPDEVQLEGNEVGVKGNAVESTV